MSQKKKLKEQIVELNGRKYNLKRWSAWDSVDMVIDIPKIFAPVIGNLKDLQKAFGAEDDKQWEALQGLLINLVRLDKAAVKPFIKDCLNGIYFVSDNEDGNPMKSGDAINPDTYFDDYLEDMLPLVIHSFKFQLSPFFKGSLPDSLSQKLQ